MLVHWIWLAHRPQLRDRDKAKLMLHFSDPEDVYYADEAALEQLGLTSEQIAALRDKDLKEAEEILGQCRAKKIHILTIRDGAYPRRLKNISDPPLVLYYKGTVQDLDGLPAIGVVGTRSATAYGLTIAKRMGYQLGKCGAVVVSGGASGIDTLAMKGALSAGMCVVGVLGCGVDVVYPAGNRALFADLEKHGCLISEFAPGTPPYKWNFPKRNRIISGLCDGVLIVEAPAKSGALITARQAADQGRDVFVVPGNIDVDACAGSNALLRDGAMPVTCGWDVLSEYVYHYPGKIRREQTDRPMALYPNEGIYGEEEGLPKVAQKPILPKKVANCSKIIIDKEELPPYSDGNNTNLHLTEQEQKILDLIPAGGSLVDDVIAASGCNAGLVLASLTMLEVKGAVRMLPGRRVERK